MKQPKTKAGKHKITLHNNALLVAKAQLSIRTESSFVFHDPKSNKQWASDQPFRARVDTCFKSSECKIPRVLSDATDFRIPNVK
jgi:hypothetical protein